MAAGQRGPLGPVRENQISIEQRGLAPVPESERYGRTFRIFSLWLSPQFTPSAIFIGVIAASLGLGFWQGLPVGHEAIQLFEKWMSWVLGLFFGIVTIRVLSSGATTSLHATVHGAEAVGLFALMLVIAGSDGYAWAPYAAEYSRYLPARTSRRRVFWYTFAGIAGGLTWMMLLGLSVARRVVNAGTLGIATAIRDLVGGGFLGVIAMVAIYLATVAVDVVNDYTGSLSLQAAGLGVRRPVLAAVNGAAGFGLSAWFLYGSGALYNKVQNLLLFFTYWISAWLGVVIVDWIRRRGRVNTSQLQDYAGLQWSAAALIAFVAGFASSIPFSNTTAGANFVASHPAFKNLVGYFPSGPLHQADLGFIVAFAVSAILYATLQRTLVTSIPAKPEEPDTDHGAQR